MRVADYIAQFISDLGVEHVFCVEGGGVMLLLDGVAQHPKLQAVHCHHEQAAAYAAVGYAKQKGDIGVCMVTTGCGCTNTLTGVLDAWGDSIPTLFISGQIPLEQTMEWTGAQVRQLGVQEVDIVPIVEPITKYAKMVMDPQRIAYHLEQAVHEARSGRPGPVWLDIPMDVQQAEIDPDQLKHFTPEVANFAPDRTDVEYVCELLEEADRPVLIVGHGVRLAGAVPELASFLREYPMPVVSSFLGTDLLDSANQVYMGCIGYKGNRAANLAIEKADLVLSIGCRLSLPATSFLGDEFAPNAKLIVVDIDPDEHAKDTVHIHQFIHADAKAFLEAMNEQHKVWVEKSWFNQCVRWKEEWPVYKPAELAAGEPLDVYEFLDALAGAMPDDGTVICDAGSTFFAVGRGFPARKGQRVIISGAQTDMGFALPGAIGACFAKGGKQVVAIQGDGSFQFNVQELQTLAHLGLDVKLFVWSNDGYLTIRASQDKSCDGRHFGTDETCGISFPEVKKIAGAYGIRYIRLPQMYGLENWIKVILGLPGPVICEVMCQRDQVMVPKEE